MIGTYALGKAWLTESDARVAAFLVAFNPVLLAQAAVPMSDTLAAAYWTWSLALSISTRARMQACAGLLAGLAIVVRPNLFPLLVGPVAGALMSSGLRGGFWLAFSCSPLVAFLGWHQNRLYGSALATGYGSTAHLFSPGYIGENVRRYRGWLWRTSSPLPIAGFLIESVRIVVRARSRSGPLRCSCSST